MTDTPVEKSDDPDDDAAAFDDLDEADWGKIDDLVDQVETIEAIEDPDEQKAAAKAWAAKLTEDEV